jgi:hypothetical protein
MPDARTYGAPRGAAGTPGFLLRLLSSCPALSGTVADLLRMLNGNSARKAKQDESAQRISELLQQRVFLRTEREILRAERALAIRQHRPVSAIDRRLKAITTQLLELEGPAQ